MYFCLFQKKKHKMVLVSEYENGDLCKSRPTGKNIKNRKSKPKATNIAFYHFVQGVLCIIGFLISAFALFIEHSKNNDSSYVALCDLNSWISCSAVLTSKYSKGFGIVGEVLGDDSILNLPNSVYGLIFFNVQLALGLMQNLFAAKALLYMSLMTLPVILYLASILIFILKDFCLVCVSTYVVNTALLFLHYKLFRYYEARSQKKLN